MSLPHDLPPTPGAAPGVAPRHEGPGLAQESLAAPTTAPSSGIRSWLIILTAGLLAGLAGFGIGEVAPKLVPPSFEISPELARNRVQIPMEIQRRKQISQDQATAIAYGGLGGVLGLALGVAGGLLRRSARAAIAAGVAGLILGGAAGAGTSTALLPSFHADRDALKSVEGRPEELSNDLALALRTHGGIWIAVGAAAGLALGLGLGGGARIARALFGGILGAGLATAIYEFAGAVAFPLAQTFRPMALEPGPRLVAHLGVALCVSALALWAAHHLQLTRATSPADRPR